MSETIAYVEAFEAVARLGALPRAGLRALSSERRRARLERAIRWGERDALESDVSRKQIIAYVALRDGAGRVFMTRRRAAGAEARLHGKLSIGIGGHLEADGGAALGAIRRGARREIAEEIAGAPSALALRMIGWLYDGGSEVGRVHLGAAFEARVRGAIEVRETKKLEGWWSTLAEARERAEELESWSRWLLEALRPARSVRR